MFNEDEVKESEYLEEAEVEKAKPIKKKVLNTYFNPVAFQKDIAINPLDVDNAFLSQASLFAHYSNQAAKAGQQMDNMKLKMDVVEAELNKFHRDEFTASGVKITEQMLVNAVTTDPRFIRVRKLYNEAKCIYEMLKGSESAFRQRKDMLIQIGAASREERKGELFMKEKASKEERINSRVSRA
jgi:hypothetical protein